MPLSPTQARIWAAQQRHPETTVFHRHFALRLRGKLHPRALTKALTTLGERHESLRTTFVMDDGAVTALVQPTFTLTVPIVRSIPTTRSPGAAKPLFAYHLLEEMRRPFDLTGGPLLRGRLFTFAADDRVLVLTMHRLIADETSVEILRQELAQLFTGYVRRERISLPSLPCQASDLAIHQQRLIESDEGARQLAFWTRQLAGLTPLTLPADRPRPTRRTNHVERVQRLVPPTLRDRLTRLARTESVPPEATLLAAVLTLLAGATGQGDVAIATRADGRHQPGAERVVGNLANTLVIRPDLGGDPSFRQLLQRVQQTRGAAHRHQDVPFERVASALRPGHSQDLADFLPVSMVWIPSFEPAAAVFEASQPGDTRLEPMPLVSDESLSELAISVAEQPDGWLVTFTYATDLFGAAWATGLLDHLLALLDDVSRDPESRLSTLTADSGLAAPASDAAVHETPPDDRVMPRVTVVPARTSLIPLCAGDERRLPAYLCPGGAGSASLLGTYQRAFEQLALDRPVYAFLATKNEDTGDGHAWTEAIAAAHVREIRLRQPAGPYLLLGSCLGGILTMAIAQHMHDAGYGLPTVVLLDSRHPTLGHMRPEEVWRNLTPRTNRRRSLQVGPPPARAGVDERTQPAQGRLEQATLDPEQIGSTDVRVVPEQGGPADPAADPARGDERYFERLLYGPRYLRLKQYRPPGYPGPVTVLGNRDWLTRYPALGWQPPAVAQLHLHEVPGDHVGFLQENIDQVGELLRPLLEEFDQAGEG